MNPATISNSRTALAVVLLFVFPYDSAVYRKRLKRNAKRMCLCHENRQKHYSNYTILHLKKPGDCLAHNVQP